MGMGMETGMEWKWIRYENGMKNRMGLDEIGWNARFYVFSFVFQNAFICQKKHQEMKRKYLVTWPKVT